MRFRFPQWILRSLTGFNAWQEQLFRDSLHNMGPYAIELKAALGIVHETAMSDRNHSKFTLNSIENHHRVVFLSSIVSGLSSSLTDGFKF